MHTYPTAQDKSSDNKKDSYEHLRTPISIGALIISILALTISVYSVRAAHKSAAAATASARAWLLSMGWSIKSMEEKEVKFSAYFGNEGNTLAYNVETSWESAFISGPDFIPPEYPRCPKTNLKLPGVIRAKGQWSVEMWGENLSEEQIRKLLDKTAQLYFHGCIKYRELINSDEERITEFSVFYSNNRGGVISIDPRYTRILQ